MTYTFTATTPGTHSYYSGTQGDLQIEMGLYGALIVLPKTIPTAAHQRLHRICGADPAHYWGEADFRLAAAAYDHAKTCYDREYLFQFSEMDPNIHSAGAGAGYREGRMHCRAPRDAASTFRPSRTIPRTS